MVVNPFDEENKIKKSNRISLFSGNVKNNVRNEGLTLQNYTSVP